MVAVAVVVLAAMVVVVVVVLQWSTPVVVNVVATVVLVGDMSRIRDCGSSSVCKNDNGKRDDRRWW